MPGKNNSYVYGRKKKRNLKTVALVITTVVLTATVLLAVSPSFRNLLASAVRTEQSEITDQDEKDKNDAAGPDASEQQDVTEPSGTEPAIIETEPEPFEEIEIELVGTGDVLLHMPVIDGVKRSIDGETVYQFDPVFRYIKNIIDGADYSVLNFEGTLGGPPYSGYP